MTYLTEDIGRQLQAERNRQGLTQRAFAAMAGTTQARISNVESGDLDPRVSSLIELARALGLEFMLVPREHVPAVRALTVRQEPSRDGEPAGFAEEGPRPAYRLDDEDDA